MKGSRLGKERLELFELEPSVLLVDEPPEEVENGANSPKMLRVGGLAQREKVGRGVLIRVGDWVQELIFGYEISNKMGVMG